VSSTPPVPPEDTVPAFKDGESDVWLTEWQIEEDGYDVAVGDEIAWALYAMDQPWVFFSRWVIVSAAFDHCWQIDRRKYLYLVMRTLDGDEPLRTGRDGHDLRDGRGPRERGTEDHLPAAVRQDCDVL
jgi:hypothetical protein